MGKPTNIFEYRRNVRVTQPDGRIGVLHYTDVGGGVRDGCALSVVARSLGVFEMLDAVNGLARSLGCLRQKADSGDEDAKFDANMQISLIDELRGRIASEGGRTRYVSDSGIFELY